MKPRGTGGERGRDIAGETVQAALSLGSVAKKKKSLSNNVPAGIHTISCVQIEGAPLASNRLKSDSSQSHPSQTSLIQVGQLKKNKMLPYFFPSFSEDLKLLL